MGHSLSYPRRKALEEELHKVCRRDERGFAIYQEGHNDKTVAEAFGCTVNNVSGLRKQCIGQIDRSPANTELQDLRQRLEDVERWCAKLESHIALLSASKVMVRGMDTVAEVAPADIQPMKEPLATEAAE